MLRSDVHAIIEIKTNVAAMSGRAVFMLGFYSVVNIGLSFASLEPVAEIAP